jgi:linoleoyl-CoA desaturase
MEPNTTKLKFKKNNLHFYEELNDNVNAIVTKKVRAKAERILKIKFLFYIVIFIFSYLNLYQVNIRHNQFSLVLNYIIIGLSGILVAFNSSHDAVHNTFSKHKKLNQFIYYITFNLQGVNARLWRTRHIASHHLFPNVDGCDADIDDNPFIRLSSTQKRYWYHAYQHIYAPLFYACYTLHWILIKDFMYLNKKDLANLKNQVFSIGDVFELIGWKFIYIVYMIVLPALFSEYPVGGILASFFIMHLVISVFFVFTLIISHLCMETEFPVADEQGNLPFDFHEHQLAVSLDYYPTSKLANWIFGGFNAHSAHHLFPRLPHTLYALITPIIKATALKYNLPYHELSMPKAILSHFKYLKKIGQA